MSISQRILDYLDTQNIPYEVIPHREAFAAQEVAATLHVSGKQFAKAVILQAEGRLLMAVLPAARRVDIHELKTELDVKHLEMVSESELAKICPDCELGAFAPLGGLYGMEVWVDRTLADSEFIVFNAGSHTEAVRMKFSDFMKVTKPHMGRFAEMNTA